jgi:hypothetical protein
MEKMRIRDGKKSDPGSTSRIRKTLVQEYNPVAYLKDKVEQVRSFGLLVEAEPVGGIVQEDDLGRELVHPRPALITPHFVHASLRIQTRVVCQP